MTLVSYHFLFITLTCHILTELEELGRLGLAHYISSYFYKCSSRSEHAARHTLHVARYWSEVLCSNIMTHSR